MSNYVKRNVYLDNNATTKPYKEVIDEMLPFFTDKFANSSSTLYEPGIITNRHLSVYRFTIAKTLDCKPNNIYFTSSGSESNNWALKGFAFANKDKGNHIITSKIEHPSILNTCKFLETIGFEVTYIGVNKEGIINIDELKNSITDKTILISIMTVNNEVGSIQPIEEIGKIAKEKNIVFHTDAVQAIGNLEIQLGFFNKKSIFKNVDMMSMSAHKFHGPKGVGILYIKDGIEIENLLHGGSQEYNKRASTTNLPGIAGCAIALKKSLIDINDKINKISKLRDLLIEGIKNDIKDCKLNGPVYNRVCNNVNYSFNTDVNDLIRFLSVMGIYVSHGSACSHNLLDTSYVLYAMHNTIFESTNSIRFSLSYETTEEDIKYTLKMLNKYFNHK